jgi:hypothetical protein
MFAIRPNDVVRVKSVLTVDLWPGNRGGFPSVGDICTVIDRDGAKLVIEKFHQDGSSQWTASIDASGLELIKAHQP